MTSDEKTSAVSLKTTFRNAGVALAVSVALGAGIPVARKLFCGSSDPFQTGWPLFLQATACLAAFAVSWRCRQRVVPAVGLYAGLAGYMLIVGNPEYPVASLIALMIHGFVPALVGSLVAFVVSCRASRLLKNRSHA